MTTGNLFVAIGHARHQLRMTPSGPFSR